MKFVWIAVVFGPIALGGCANAEMLKRQAIEEAKAECFKRGKQFALTEAEAKDGRFTSSTMVKGVCIDSSDPRYVSHDTSSGSAQTSSSANTAP